jgi:6-phosphogluconolactonase
MQPLVAVPSICAWLLVASAVGLSLSSGQHGKGKPLGDTLVFLGTYTGEKSRGIYVSRLELASGALTMPQLAAETTSPSYLAIHPDARFVYAANEVSRFGGKDTGSVSAFAVEPTSGMLRPLNQQASGGDGPAHLIVDKSGRNVLVANYGGGSVAVLPIGADGGLRPASAVAQHTGSSVDPKRQTKPYAHSINLDPANRFAYAADLGLDKVFIYRFSPDPGSLMAADPPFATVEPGSGPRHFAIHPDRPFAYVINEMAMTITVFNRNAESGALTTVHTVSTLPNGQSVQSGFSTADLQVHPSGKFLYGSNRGHDTIVSFAIDRQTGRLTYIEHQSTQGRTPRAFGIDPTGRYLLAANQRSDSVVVFRIDTESGRLTPTGHTVNVGSPVCVKFIGR